MVKILVVCGNGIGTSKLIKVKMSKFLESKGLKAQVESCSVQESEALIRNFELIVCSRHLENQIKTGEDKRLVALKNLMDEKEYGEKLLETVNKLESNRK